MRMKNNEMNESMLDQVNGGIIYCSSDSVYKKFDIYLVDENTNERLGIWSCMIEDYEKGYEFLSEAKEWARKLNLSDTTVSKDLGVVCMMVYCGMMEKNAITK